MKTVDKMEVLHSQSAEFIEKGETGKFLKLIPDTFIIKGGNKNGVFNQGYALRHLNQKEMLLIDVVEEATKDAVKKLVNDGYSIQGIVITCDKVMNSAYADLKTMSQDAGGASIYAHPLHSFKDNSKTKNIITDNNLKKKFGLKIYDLPGNGGASILVYSEINGGMLFPGDDAVGSPYGSEENEFKRPDMEKQNDDYGMAESWRNFTEEFEYIFPRKGKPGFNLDESWQSILANLGKS